MLSVRQCSCNLGTAPTFVLNQLSAPAVSCVITHPSRIPQKTTRIMYVDTQYILHQDFLVSFYPADNLSENPGRNKMLVIKGKLTFLFCGSYKFIFRTTMVTQFWIAFFKLGERILIYLFSQTQFLNKHSTQLFGKKCYFHGDLPSTRKCLARHVNKLWHLDTTRNTMVWFCSRNHCNFDTLFQWGMPEQTPTKEKLFNCKKNSFSLR